MSKLPDNKHIVFINQSSGYLMVDIINAYLKEGYSCSLIAGILVERAESINEKVKIHRIIKYDRSSTMKRLYTWGWGTIQILLKLVFKYRDAHLFIVSNPPTATLLPLILRNSYSLLIFDVYPDAITELGVMKENSILVKFWKKGHKKVFLKASNIFTITEGMKSLLKSYSGSKEITVVPLWTDNEFLKPVPAENNPFLLEYSMSDKFVVLYSGNIGITGNVEVLAEIAKNVENKDIQFIVIGNGSRKKTLEEKVKEFGLSNFLILPWQDVTRLPFTLSAANLGVVSLGSDASKLAIPSKLYSLLSVGVPILGIAGHDSDLNKLIEESEIGKCFSPEQIDEIADYISSLAADTQNRNKLMRNALRVSKTYTKHNVSLFLNSKI